MKTLKQPVFILKIVTTVSMITVCYYAFGLVDTQPKNTAVIFLCCGVVLGLQLSDYLELLGNVLHKNGDLADKQKDAPNKKMLGTA